MKLTRKILESIPLLQGSDLDIVYGILKDVPIIKIPPKDVFIKRGDPSEHMYLILKGKLDIHVEKLEDPSILTLKEGDSVGEMALLDGKPRSAFVVAQTKSDLLEINNDIFWTLINSSHDITINLLLILSSRLRGNNETITESLELQKKYRTSATVDSLTGLHNRKWLNETLPRILERAKIGKTVFSVAMIDIDHFKNFNDTYGHQAGDFVLTNVAKAYTDNIRPTDFAARYGGEEFTLIFPDRSMAKSKTAAERVRKAVMALELTTPTGVKLPTVTVSIGLAEFKEGDTMASLIERSDKALYDAKETGRNKVV